MTEEIYEKFEDFENIGFDINPDRGERSEFLKITITVPKPL